MVKSNDKVNKNFPLRMELADKKVLINWIKTFDEQSKAMDIVLDRRKTTKEIERILGVCAVCGRNKEELKLLKPFDRKLQLAHVESQYSGGESTTGNMCFLCDNGKKKSAEGCHADFDAGFITEREIEWQRKKWDEMLQTRIDQETEEQADPAVVKAWLGSDALIQRIEERKTAVPTNLLFVRQPDFENRYPFLKGLGGYFQRRQWDKLRAAVDPRLKALGLSTIGYNEESAILTILLAQTWRRSSGMDSFTEAEKHLANLKTSIAKFPELQSWYYYEVGYLAKLRGKPRIEVIETFKESLNAEQANPLEKLLAEATCLVIEEMQYTEIDYSDKMDRCESIISRLKSRTIDDRGTQKEHPFANRWRINLKVYEYKYTLIMEGTYKATLILNELIELFKDLDRSCGWAEETKYTICSLRGIDNVVRAQEEISESSGKRVPNLQREDMQNNLLTGLGFLARSIIASTGKSYQSLEGLEDALLTFLHGIELLSYSKFESYWRGQHLNELFKKYPDSSSYFEKSPRPLIKLPGKGRFPRQLGGNAHSPKAQEERV